MTRLRKFHRIWVAWKRDRTFPPAHNHYISLSLLSVCFGAADLCVYGALSCQLISCLRRSLNRTCGSRGPRTRRPTNFLASCAGLKSSPSPQWVWGACVPARPPNQMRICSLAQRQSIWFVHLSCIDSRVDAGVQLPRLTTGHVRSRPEGPHWFTKPSLKPVSTENSYTAQIQQSSLTVDFPVIELSGLLYWNPVDDGTVWLWQTDFSDYCSTWSTSPLHPTAATLKMQCFSSCFDWLKCCTGVPVPGLGVLCW